MNLRRETDGITFGFITDGQNRRRLKRAIDGVAAQVSSTPLEVVVVGGPPPTPTRSGLPITHVPFDDLERKGWVTRKKNLIAQVARYQAVVFAHDYIGVRPGWVAGFERFGFDWDIAMTRVEDVLGRRFYDWVTWDHPDLPRYSPVKYSDAKAWRHLFIPGGYWIAKRDFMLANPLDESLVWGQSEDVEWSLRVRSERYVMNPFSVVRHLKRHRGFRLHKAIY